MIRYFPLFLYKPTWFSIFFTTSWQYLTLKSAVNSGEVEKDRIDITSDSSAMNLKYSAKSFSGALQLGHETGFSITYRLPCASKTLSRCIFQTGKFWPVSFHFPIIRRRDSSGEENVIADIYKKIKF